MSVMKITENKSFVIAVMFTGSDITVLQICTFFKILSKFLSSLLSELKKRSNACGAFTAVGCDRRLKLPLVALISNTSLRFLYFFKKENRNILQYTHTHA